MVQNSRFFYHGDDAVNVHTPTSLRGFSYAPRSPVDPTPDYSKIILVRSRAWRMFFEVGDEVAFLRASDMSITGVSRRVVRAAYDGTTRDRGRWELDFDAPLDPNADPVFAQPWRCGLYLPRYSGSNVIVRNITTGFHRARGVLIQNRETSVIERSSLERVMMSAVLVRASEWTQEGVGTRNMVIADNNMKNVDIVVKHGAIVVDATNYAGNRVWNRGWLGTGNVSIESNVMTGTASRAVSASNIYGIRAFNNRIQADVKRSSTSVAGQIVIGSSMNVQQRNNTRCESRCARSASWSGLPEVPRPRRTTRRKTTTRRRRTTTRRRRP